MIILIILYLVSAFIVWRFISIQHSKGGFYEHQDTGFGDLVFTIVPGLNTIAAILIVAMTDANFNKFFNVKK